MSFQRRKIVRALTKRKFAVVREGGQHTIMEDSFGNVAILPRHKEINRLTARSIAKSAGIEWAEFVSEIS